METRLVTVGGDLRDGDGEEGSGSRDSGGQLQLRFTLPPGDREVDAQYFARLDEGTRLRRRVYEMLIAEQCRQLTELDGLSFCRDSVLVRDEVWERLVLLGVVKKSRRADGQAVGGVAEDDGLAV
jgi:hypothetical protein